MRRALLVVALAGACGPAGRGPAGAPAAGELAALAASWRRCSGPGGPDAPGWLRPPPAGARPLGALALEPERLTNLPGLLTAAGWLLAFGGDAAERLAGALARYRRAQLNLWLDDSTLVLRGAMRLRP